MKRVNMNKHFINRRRSLIHEAFIMIAHAIVWWYAVFFISRDFIYVATIGHILIYVAWAWQFSIENREYRRLSLENWGVDP